MEMAECYTIDELYQKVKDYDLVLTTEAHLADALNNRIEKPYLGKFADTPRRYILSKVPGKIKDERELFIKIIHEMDITWKQASYLLGNIIECWKETGNVKKILEFKRFNNKNVKNIINILENTKNSFSLMDNYQINGELSVAVINFFQFNELDKKVLHKNFDVINPFKEGKTKQIAEFMIFNSGTEIIQTLIVNITKVNPNDVAIVLEPESRFQALIESALQTNNIPYLIRKNLSEDEDLRTFLLLMRAALTEKSLHLKDVQPILHHFGIRTPIINNEKFFNKLNIENENLKKFKYFMTSVNGAPFNEVLKKYEELLKHDVNHIREHFEELNLLKKELNDKSLNQLEYYLDSFEIPVDTSISGVLFVSPKSVAYVDRPIVFYIGMDASWTSNIPEKPWINQERFEERNLSNFKILLQNGEKQYFLIQEKIMNEKITHCFYFNEILDEKIDSFSDLPHSLYRSPITEKEINAFQKEAYDVEIEEIKTISQTDLNNFVQCPRGYMFSKLIREPENSYMKKGELYHNFAEFYINHRNFINERGLDEFIDLILEIMKPHVYDLYLEQLRTELEFGIKLIIQYLEERINLEEIKNLKLDGFEEKKNDNIFVKKYQRPIESTITEMFFKNTELGVSGIVDLIQAENHLLDFKSGPKKSQNHIIKNSNIDFLEDEPNFQAILYLTHLRQIFPNNSLKFTFYHFLNNLKDQVSGSGNIDDNLVTINYYPESFEEFILKEETFNALCAEVSRTNDRRKVLDTSANEKAMGYENYREFFQDCECIHEYNEVKIENSSLANKFITYAKGIIGEYRYVEKGCISILKKLVRMRKKMFLKKDLDKFENKLEEWIEELNRYKKSKFPIDDLDFDKAHIDRSVIYYGKD